VRANDKSRATLLQSRGEVIREDNLSKGLLVSVSSLTGFARAEVTTTCTGEVKNLPSWHQTNIGALQIIE